MSDPATTAPTEPTAHRSNHDDYAQIEVCRSQPPRSAGHALARRPELDNALQTARAGDQLVVTKLDRLGRSLEHLIELSNDLQRREVDLVVLDQGIDTSTAIGRMFSKSSARLPSSLLSRHAVMSERTRDGLAAAEPAAGSAAPTQTPTEAGRTSPTDVRPDRRTRPQQIHRRPDRRRVRRQPPHHLPLPRSGAQGRRTCLLKLRSLFPAAHGRWTVPCGVSDHRASSSARPGYRPPYLCGNFHRAGVTDSCSVETPSYFLLSVS